MHVVRGNQFGIVQFQMETANNSLFSARFMIKYIIIYEIRKHNLLYTPPHDSGSVLWFHFVVRVSVRLSVRPYFRFRVDYLSKCQWIVTKLGMCIDVLEIWFGLLVDKFRQFLTELSTRHTSIV